MRKILVIIGLLFLFLPIVHAAKSEDFINYSANIIFESCKGEEIFFEYIKIDDTSIESIPWPDYDISKIHQIISAYAKTEPFIKCEEGPFARNCFRAGRLDGSNILDCGELILDINGEEWYWNETKLEIPPTITNINENNLIKIGTLNLTIFQFSFALISISLISVAIILLILVSVKKELNLSIFNKTYSFKIIDKNKKS